MEIRNSLWFFLSVMILFFSSKTHLTVSDDTISVGQSLSGIQTIISKQGNFELGFFAPGNSLNYYIGIWYKKISTQNRTVVWVANREKPLRDPPSSELKLLENGNLVLFNQSKIPIWSTDSTSNTSGSSEAVLGDDGNLIVRDVLNKSVVIWQSFDNPTNTWLPGGKLGLYKSSNKAQILTSWRNEEDPAHGIFSVELDPGRTNQFIMKSNGYQAYWRSGEWDGKIFTLLPEMRTNYIFNFGYVSNDEERYFTYTIYNKSIVSRLLMDLSGQIKQFTWTDYNQQWNLFWSQPKQQCDVYGICGAFGSCNQDAMKCGCLPGFEESSSKEWNLGSSYGGCVRKTPLQCGNKDVFSPIANVKMPVNNHTLAVGSADECNSACTNKCTCNAYAYGSNGCSLWDGDLLNLEQLADGGDDIYLKLAAIDIAASTNQKRKGRMTPVWKLIIIIATITLVTTTFCVLGYIFLRRKKTHQRGAPKKLQAMKNKDNTKDSPNEKIFKDVENEAETPELPLFDLASIATATNNFCLTNKLGEGGFGPVYKGKLQNGQEIAVKRLSKSSGQGIEEFKNEVILISKLQHRNLVKLLGCCIEGEENMLLYEYMPNNSLDAFLFDARKKAQLDWNNRFNIIQGIARGLLYLHRDSRLKIIHRDLKASNILLDENMNPKISDFGMARIFGGNQTIANTNRVVGTFGYMSPEYIMGGTFSEKSDVFSFGVLILETISSKRNNSFYDPEQPLNLILHTWRLWNEGKWKEIVDEALDDSYFPLEVMRCIHVGLLCVQKKAADRPTMATVDLMLSSEMTCPPPKEPPFTTETSSESNFLQIRCSNNNVTITTVEGR